MDINERKKRVAYAETGLDSAFRRLKRTMTSVKFWERKLRIQQRALQSEMEAKMTLPIEDDTRRRFR